ncbi:MAG: hypothetical protein U1D30_18950 [Planctomycetota bacterium]
MAQFLRFSERLQVLPVVHGSGDFSIRVREELLKNNYDCLAVPLPATFLPEVLAAVEHLPAISAVFQQEATEGTYTYVPIDPCQPVIAAIRFALRERMAIEFIDLESSTFSAPTASLPDPYALKRLPVEKYLAAILPTVPSPEPNSLSDQRVRRMAFELHRLELEYENILFVPSVLDWPWIRNAYFERSEYPEHEPFFSPIKIYRANPRSLTFLLGELPFVTALYERSRATLDPDDNLSIDGVKELVIEARDRWSKERSDASQWLTPKLLGIFFQYVRNLTLLARRLSPDLYTLIVAAKQIGGDGFALEVLKTATSFPVEFTDPPFEEFRMGIGEGTLPGEGVVSLKNRLPGQDVTWRSCELLPDPPKRKSQQWRTLWDPYKQCSWPAEDERIESFHTHVRDQAKALIGADLARSEKFTSSVKDGIDVRETLRNWHTGNIYVQEIPPSRGGLEIVVFLFDVPADPDQYTWRATWYAEHGEESTIGLYATDFRKDMIGPGIGRAVYGGVFFLFPPRLIPDIWSDPRLPQSGPLEERLIAAAVLHSSEPHIAVVSPCPLKAAWRRMATRQGKRLIHLPLSRFSGRTVDRLRVAHVLNGKEVRSYAASFIREG